MTETQIQPAETRALKTFAAFMMSPNQMLCFSGPELEKHRAALETLSDKELLTREKRAGAYSLTRSGYEEMKRACTAS
ncbi:MAG: hypothetical protein AAGJ46_12320 [Planctomycetota bacterium]